MPKQSERTPRQVFHDYPPSDPAGPTVKECVERLRVVRVGGGTWPAWEDVHRLVVEHHYLHAWAAHTLMFAVVVDDFHIAAVAVFGVGGRMLPGSLMDGWAWVNKDRGGHVLELQRMYAQPWAPKGLVSWFFKRCRIYIREYYPQLKAIVVYVAPGSVDRWTKEPTHHTGKTYALYCRGLRLPDTGGHTEYMVNNVWVSSRQMSKVLKGNGRFVAGGTVVGDPNPDVTSSRFAPPKHRFIWFEHCDPRHIIKRMKKPVIPFTVPEPDDSLRSFDYTPLESEVDE